MATTKRTARKTARTARKTGRKVATHCPQDGAQGGNCPQDTSESDAYIANC